MYKLTFPQNELQMDFLRVSVLVSRISHFEDILSPPGETSTSANLRIFADRVSIKKTSFYLSGNSPAAKGGISLIKNAPMYEASHTSQ